VFSLLVALLARFFGGDAGLEMAPITPLAIVVFIPSLPHYEIPLPAFVIYTTALSVIAAWLLKHTRGSVLIATFLHGATNTFGFLTPTLDVATRRWLIAGVYSAGAILIIVMYGGQLYRARSTASLGVKLTES
jgi:membrane protease YdiL (CAAX protease family)